MEYVTDRLPGYDQYCPSIPPELYYELVCQKCGKYFPTKTFLKMHIKATHPSGAKRVARVAKENEHNEIPDVPNNADEISHVCHKETISNTKNIQANKRDSKYKRNSAKNSSLHPWEQDHLTFQINRQ